VKLARILRPKEPLEIKQLETPTTVETDVGLFGGALQSNLISIPTRAYRLIGSYTRNLIEIAELVSLAKSGIIKPVISDRFKLNQAAEAMSKLKEGKIIDKGVLNP
jgi:propanol-preferring alcohol dehydrogenase